MTFADLVKCLSKRTRIDESIIEEILYQLGTCVSEQLTLELSKCQNPQIHIPKFGTISMSPDKRAKYGYKIKLHESFEFYKYLKGGHNHGE